MDINSNRLKGLFVKHLPEFGKLCYVYVSTDTFSDCIFASVHAGEKAKDVCQHLLSAFAKLGVPKMIKTDNGPGYGHSCNPLFFSFQQWGIQHLTGSPHGSSNY